MTNFKSNNKSYNQYMIHAEKIGDIETTDAYQIIEFKRGLDLGFALIIDDKVVEIYKDDRYKWDSFKKQDDHIEQVKECWAYFA